MDLDEIKNEILAKIHLAQIDKNEIYQIVAEISVDAVYDYDKVSHSEENWNNKDVGEIALKYDLINLEWIVLKHNNEEKTSIFVGDKDTKHSVFKELKDFCKENKLLYAEKIIKLNYVDEKELL